MRHEMPACAAVSLRCLGGGTKRGGTEPHSAEVWALAELAPISKHCLGAPRLRSRHSFLSTRRCDTACELQ